MKISRFVFCFLSILLLCDCSTTPPPQSPEYLPKSHSHYTQRERNTPRYNDIDINQLIDELQMNHKMERLGFSEKPFNTCQVKSNKSKNPSCQTLYLTRLNFQVMCRNSTGTVQKVSLKPLTSRRLRWKRAGQRGYTSTNSRGFGTLGFITPRSARRGHLYLYLGNKIARKRFLDQWKLILPMSWCLSQ